MEVIDRVYGTLKQRDFFVPGSKVLDLGCGNCYFAANLVNEKIFYYGLDVQKWLVKSATIRFHETGKFKFYHLDIENRVYNPYGKVSPVTMRLPFTDSFFDAIICKSVFTHLGPLAIAVHYAGEISRVLKPGGKLFSTWFSSPPNDLCNDEMRTVYHLSDIFHTIHNYDHSITKESTTTDFNDQLEIVSVKR